MPRYSSRPLPPYRHEPGKTPHPERHPEGHLFGKDLEPREDDFLYAVDLFNARYWWEAHVYWEGLWAAASGTEAELLQGLIQLAAAMVKRRAGNREGEAKLLARSLTKLRAAHERGCTMGVDVDALIAQIEDGREPEIEL